MITPVSQHRAVLSTPQTLAPHPSLCMSLSAPKRAPPAFPRLRAHPACLAPDPWLCLTPLLLRSLARTLPYPQALRHRSSKSPRVRGKSRSDFASRRARNVAHSPGVPVLTRSILQSRPPPCATFDARPRNVQAPRIRR